MKFKKEKEVAPKKEVKVAKVVEEVFASMETIDGEEYTVIRNKKGEMMSKSIL